MHIIYIIDATLSWVNPTEEIYSHEENIELLSQAVQALKPKQIVHDEVLSRYK